MRQVIEAKQLLRILDANVNRAKEGLRVCEDVSRYGWNRAVLTRQFKNIRHKLSKVASSLKWVELIRARDSQFDVGRSSTKSEFQRHNLDELFLANSQRVKESLRVLEEVAKVFEPACAQQFKELRYELYALEKKAFS